MQKMDTHIAMRVQKHDVPGKKYDFQEELERSYHHGKFINIGMLSSGEMQAALEKEYHGDFIVQIVITDNGSIVVPRKKHSLVIVLYENHYILLLNLTNDGYHHFDSLNCTDVFSGSSRVPKVCKELQSLSSDMCGHYVLFVCFAVLRNNLQTIYNLKTALLKVFVAEKGFVNEFFIYYFAYMERIGEEFSDLEIVSKLQFMNAVLRPELQEG